MAHRQGDPAREAVFYVSDSRRNARRKLKTMNFTTLPSGQIATAPGAYLDMPDSDYRQIDAVSQSTLKRFAQCPRKWRLAPPVEPTPKMIYGSLVDALWLRRDASEFAFAPEGMDARTKEGKAFKAQAESEGKTFISYDVQCAARAAIGRLEEVAEIRHVRATCHAQVAIVWEMHGILCKGLLDLVRDDGMIVGDLKTAPSADPAIWGKYVFNNRLHWQAAFYSDGVRTLFGTTPQWFHIVSEQDAPHEPAGIVLSESFLELGRSQYIPALLRFAECKKSNVFPGYPLNAVCEPETWMWKGETSCTWSTPAPLTQWT